MIFPINLVENAGMKCQDMAQATAAHIFSRDYELMFINTWKFNFVDTNEYDCIGNKILVNKQNIKEDLEKYHGINTQEFNHIPQNEAINFIINNINHGRPVFMLFDQFYLPWAKKNRKEAPVRYDGNIMIVGHSIEKNEFYCIDIHGSKNNEVLPMQYFIDFANTQRYLNFIVYYKCDIEYKIDLDAYIDSKLDEVFGINKEKQNMFDNIKEFGQVIKESFDMEKEIKYTQKMNIEIIAPARIICIKNFIDISRMRNLYSLSLLYLSRLYKNDNLLNLSNEFKLLGANWQIIISLLNKAYLKQDFYGLENKISKKIIEISDFEKEMAYKLDKCKSNNKFIYSEDENTVINRATSEIIRVDIKKYCNNKGISTKLMNNENANFDGLNNYYLMNRIPSNEELQDDICSYNIISSGKDNIICKEQIIEFEIKTYNYICFLSACDSCAFYGKFTVFYADGSCDDFIIGFGEWRFDKCEMGEKNIWMSERYYQNRVKGDEKAYLFSNKILIDRSKKVKYMRLPQCDNMHIFAITLVI